MQNLRNLLVKLLLYAILLGSLLPALGRAPLGDALLASLGLSAVLYTLGDLLLLPFYGPGWAAAADAGLAYITLWGLDQALPGFRLPRFGLLGAALVIAGAEFFFHRFLQAKDPVPQHRPPGNPG